MALHQAGWDLEKPDPAEDVPTQGRVFELDDP